MTTLVNKLSLCLLATVSDSDIASALYGNLLWWQNSVQANTVQSLRLYDIWFKSILLSTVRHFVYVASVTSVKLFSHSHSHSFSHWIASH